MQSYLALIGLFHLGLAALAARGKKKKTFLRPIPLGDLALCGVATHQASHLLADDRVGKPLRKPFVEHEEDGRERPTGSGTRRAIGELVTCPFCAGPWIALGMMGLYQLSPGAARATAGVLSVSAMSDGLHHARKLLQTKQRELESVRDALASQAELERQAAAGVPEITAMQSDETTYPL